MFIDGVKLHIDHKYYEQEKFEVITGFPEDPFYHDGKANPDQLGAVYVDGVRIRTELLEIDQPEYKELWERKEITLYYLPLSQMAVDWESS